MNVLKVFKDEKYMDMYFDNFVQYSGKHKEVSLSGGFIKTKEDIKVYFRTVTTIEEAWPMAGMNFKEIDYWGFHSFLDKDEEIMNFLNSRIRG